MPRILDGITVALLGGDSREVILAEAMAREGARLILVGHIPSQQPAATHCDLLQAVTAADAVVAPMTNTDEAGQIKAVPDGSDLILDETVFARMAGKVLFIGLAKPVIQLLASRFGVRVVETAENDEIAILNSIPTAEGAIARAMAELPITIHGSRSVVVGFGRCGMTLARMLHALGAQVTVAARNPAQLARAWEMGLHAMHLEELSEAAATADVVYNTVPMLVITAEVVAAMRPEALIVDIASAPGGTDFAAAQSRGIKAFLDLGIPGKVAPRTAGEILARTIPRLIADACRHD